MKVKFLSNTEYQTFPETEDMLDVDETLLNQIGITKQYVNGEIVDYKVPSINKRISELKKLLKDTDYQAIKFAEGEITAEKFEPIKAQRKVWRAEINLLEEQLKQLTNP